jgi:hypothetical protein
MNDRTSLDFIARSHYEETTVYGYVYEYGEEGQCRTAHRRQIGCFA